MSQMDKYIDNILVNSPNFEGTPCSSKTHSDQAATAWLVGETLQVCYRSKPHRACNRAGE